MTAKSEWKRLGPGRFVNRRNGLYVWSSFTGFTNQTWWHFGTSDGGGELGVSSTLRRTKERAAALAPRLPIP